MMLENMEGETMEENKSGGFKAFYSKHKKKFNFAYTIIICLVIAKLITSFVFISVMVDGESMLPTLNNGDKAITDGLFYKIGGIDRFDIVIVEHKKFDSKLVKRVIGLPGETIEYRDSVLYINGEKVEEEFLPEGMITETMHGNDILPVTLDDDEYYVLGDNRENSTDSRMLGPIKKNQIKGRGILLFATCDSVTSGGKCSGLNLKWPKTIK